VLFRSGPYPLDPNLLAQGVPPDDRATSDGHIFGPLEGTPPGPQGPGAPAPPERPAPPGPPPPPATGASTPAAPSAFRPGDSGRQPSFAFAQYDPGSGKYLTPDGHTYRRSDLEAGTVVKTWKDMLLRQNT